jgi:hypothetical protein
MYRRETTAPVRELLAALFLLLGIGLPPAAQAHETNIDSRRLVKQAELIFQGVVTDVSYRVSDVVQPKEDVAIPHTFVTFQIERRWKGRSAAQGRITLRFEGGLDAATDDILQLSGMPLFDIGERVILFAAGNTVRICPVAGWDRGRFRVVNGQIFGEYGEEVWLTPSHEIVFGRPHPLPEALNHSIDGTPFVLDGSEPPQTPWTPLPGWRRADLSSFAAALSALVQELHTSGELAALAPVPDASMKQKFVVKEAKASPPPPLANVQ